MIQNNFDTINVIFRLKDEKNHFIGVTPLNGDLKGAKVTGISLQSGHDPDGLAAGESAKEKSMYGDRVCLWFFTPDSIDVVIKHLGIAKKAFDEPTNNS